MAKRGGRFRGGRGRGRSGGGGAPRAERAAYQEVPKRNELYERYYNYPGFVEVEEQGEFWSTLRRELPNSFRFTGSKGHALPVQQRLKDYYIPEIISIRHEGQLVPPPTPLPWYPDELGWQMTTPKSVIRKFGPFASFQKFLVSETSVGNISRQEAVSMIPPLLMDVRPGMTVLDLCAAPGSKAAQLIEMVHAGEEVQMRLVTSKLKRPSGRETSPDGLLVGQEKPEVDLDSDWSDDGRTTGLLIANDVDYKRAHMLIHQMKRLNSPNLIVTNHDATLYPSIKLPSDLVHQGGVVKGKYLKFDRILADVPCSGDGTCRKNINVWKDWNPGNSLGLYPTQVRILVRAIQMLKVGGRVVYSTCSMNPVENEAVVASAIDRCGGLHKVGLLDCSDALPALKRKPGLSSWNVMDKQGNLWNSWQDVQRYSLEHNPDSLGKLAEGMFPPGAAELHNETIPLERCVRVYGHQQDTGGFFITVLEKRSEIRPRPENEPKRVEKEANIEQLESSIFEVVAEIEGMPIDSTNPIERITTLDGIAQPETNGDLEGNASAAARQNMKNTPSYKLTPQKRELDDIADAEMATKRPKFRSNDEGPAPREAEDKHVHFPPPPGAQLDFTRPPDKNTASSQNFVQTHLKKKNNRQFEEPFKYLDPENEELQTIFDFYKIHPRFPRDRFMVRNATGNPVKTIYYTSALARNILTENEGKGMKFVHCGVKMFVKQDVQRDDVCRWRIQTDGLPIVEAWVGDERVVRLWSRKTFRCLLVEMFPKVTGDGWRQLGEIGERVRDIEMGCCVLRVETSEGEDGFSERMVIPLWRSMHSLNLMLPKEDRKAMLLRLYNDDSPLVDHSKDRFGVITNGHGDDENGTRSTVNAPTLLVLNGNGESPQEVEAEAAGNAESADEEEGGVGLDAEAADVQEQARVEMDVALGAEEKEDTGLDGGVEVGLGQKYF